MSLHALYDTRVANHLSTLVAHGYRVTYINWSKTQPRFGVNLPRYARMLRWFRKQAKQVNADLYHLHDLLLLPLIKGLKSKTVFDVHEDYERFPGRLSRFARMARKRYLPHVDGVVATCAANLPPTTAPHVIVPNYQRAQPLAGGERDDSVRVIYFGSLNSEDREVTVMLDVAQHCLERCESVTFEFGGPVAGFDAPTNQKRLQNMAEQWHKRFTWHGLMARDLVIERTRGADVGLIFVRPDSPNLHGGSWNKIYEYLAAGCAILATDGFDVADRVRKSGAGRLFGAGYPQTSAAAILEQLIPLIENRDALSTMQTAAGELGQQFSWDAVAERYIDLYSQVLR